MDELKKEWGDVHLVCVPIGHAGTLLAKLAEHLAVAMATRLKTTSKPRECHR